MQLTSGERQVGKQINVTLVWDEQFNGLRYAVGYEGEDVPMLLTSTQPGALDEALRKVREMALYQARQG